MSGMKTMLSSIILIGGLGIGFVLWAAVAPGEDRRREITKNLPKSNPMRMEENRGRTLMLQVLKGSAEAGDSRAGGSGPSK